MGRILHLRAAAFRPRSRARVVFLRVGLLGGDFPRGVLQKCVPMHFLCILQCFPLARVFLRWDANFANNAFILEKYCVLDGISAREPPSGDLPQAFLLEGCCKNGFPSNYVVFCSVFRSPKYSVFLRWDAQFKVLILILEK